jgi:hypothetical protein
MILVLGEYIDLDAFLGDWDNMHRAMAVLYRPIEKNMEKVFYKRL